MTKQRNSLLVVLLLLLGSQASAQTARALLWDYPVAPAVAQAYVHTVTLDGAVLPGATTCTARTGGSTCEHAIPSLTTGTHVLVVTAASGGMTVNSSLTVDTNAFPTTVTNPRLVINVTVVVP